MFKSVLFLEMYIYFFFFFYYMVMSIDLNGKKIMNIYKKNEGYDVFLKIEGHKYH